MAAKSTVAVNFIRYFIRLSVYSLYCFCWYFSSVLDYIVHILLLVNQHSANTTARAGRIWWRKKFSIMSVSSAMDFICAYRTRVKPEYVLKSNIVLYVVTKKEAIFVETPEMVNIFSSDTHPFLFVAQFLNATKVITMCISDLLSLADKIGNPRLPVVWISNTGRCGGTLLSQLFETVPGTLVIHEPEPPTNLYHLHEDSKLSTSEYGAMLKSTIRIMCKPHPGITRICIKPRPICSGMMTDITKHCSYIKQLFVYRNSLDTLTSWLGIMAYDPHTVVVRTCVDALWFSNICPYFRDRLVYHFVVKLQDAPELPKDSTTACVMCYSWANQILIACDAMSRDKHILSVKYEDIISRPKETVGQIFDSLGIDLTNVDNATVALLRDSQRGSDVSRDRIGDTSNRFMSSKDKIRSDDILHTYNLPRLGEDFRI